MQPPTHAHHGSRRADTEVGQPGLAAGGLVAGRSPGFTAASCQNPPSRHPGCSLLPAFCTSAARCQLGLTTTSIPPFNRRRQVPGEADAGAARRGAHDGGADERRGRVRCEGRPVAGPFGSAAAPSLPLFLSGARWLSDSVPSCTLGRHSSWPDSSPGNQIRLCTLLSGGGGGGARGTRALRPTSPPPPRAPPRPGPPPPPPVSPPSRGPAERGGALGLPAAPGTPAGPRGVHHEPAGLHRGQGGAGGRRPGGGCHGALTSRLCNVGGGFQGMR
jgi:hypothetical protein